MKARNHVLFIVLCLLCLPVVAGGRLSANETISTGSLPEDLISALSDAVSDEEVREAVVGILVNGFSLGLLDENGRQLNPNIGPGAVSLGQSDIDVYRSLSGYYNYRTVGHVIDYLSGIGVMFDTTGTVVSEGSLLPEIQKYVVWSFANRDESESLLGLMIGSGSELEIPESPPQISASTVISPLTGLLITADILLGVEEKGLRKTAEYSLPWSDVGSPTSVEPAGAGGDMLIKGLITVIKPILKNFNKEIREITEELLLLYETNDYFAVRLIDTPAGEHIGDFKRFVQLSRPGEEQYLSAIVVARPTNKVAAQIPVHFTFNLISRRVALQQEPLFEDADAVLADTDKDYPRGVPGSLVSMNGHRIMVPSSWPRNPGAVILLSSKMENRKHLEALLHISARIPFEDMDKLPAEYMDKLRPMWEKIKALAALLENEVKPVSWLCEIQFAGQLPPLPVIDWLEKDGGKLVPGHYTIDFDVAGVPKDKRTYGTSDTSWSFIRIGKDLTYQKSNIGVYLAYTGWWDRFKDRAFGEYPPGPRYPGLPVVSITWCTKDPVTENLNTPKFYYFHGGDTLGRDMHRYNRMEPIGKNSRTRLKEDPLVEMDDGDDHLVIRVPGEFYALGEYDDNFRVLAFYAYRNCTIDIKLPAGHEKILDEVLNLSKKLIDEKSATLGR